MALLHELPSNKTGAFQELLPADLGFSAVALSAGRKVGTLVRISGFGGHCLIVQTTGGAGTGRSELEFTGYALDQTTIVVPRTVVLGGTADIFHTAGTACGVQWGMYLPDDAYSPATAATVTGAAVLFSGVPYLLVELNPTTADGTATVDMWLYSVK